MKTKEFEIKLMSKVMILVLSYNEFALNVANKSDGHIVATAHFVYSSSCNNCMFLPEREVALFGDELKQKCISLIKKDRDVCNAINKRLELFYNKF